MASILFHPSVLKRSFLYVSLSGVILFCFVLRKDGFGHKGVEEKWFDEYDWVIRLNPDVLILDDKWLLEIMRNSSIDGIFQDCTVCLLHTDFFAVRPRAVNSILVDKSKNGNAELHATKSALVWICGTCRLSWYIHVRAFWPYSLRFFLAARTKRSLCFVFGTTWLQMYRS
jgi:hypothetical protein